MMTLQVLNLESDIETQSGRRLVGEEVGDLGLTLEHNSGEVVRR